MQQHRKTVRTARPRIRRGAQECRPRWRVNRVVNHQVRREQGSGQRRRIRATHPERRRVHHQIDIRDLKTQGAFLPRHRFQSRHRRGDARIAEGRFQFRRELLRFFQRRDSPTPAAHNLPPRIASRWRAPPPPAPNKSTRRSRKSTENSLRIARAKPGPSGIRSAQFALATRTVLIAPTLRAKSSNSSTNPAAAILCGTVRLTPTKFERGQKRQRLRQFFRRESGKPRIASAAHISPGRHFASAAKANAPPGRRKRRDGSARLRRLPSRCFKSANGQNVSS